MASKGSKKEELSQEKIISKFHQLRQEQRAVASKITELEAEKTEHRIVSDALKATDPERRCFRMVGGVLVERTVKDVLPALIHNTEQIELMITKLTEQLTEKGKELNAFREKYGIKVVDERDSKDSAASSDSKLTPAGVLVS